LDFGRTVPALRGGAVLLLVIGLSGCLDFTDDEGPVMSVELFWDEHPDSATFIPGECETANVDTMEWHLVRKDDGVEVASNVEACANGIDIVDPRPGTYALKITGFDSDGTKVWATRCSGLTVLRFDVGYECDICDVDNGSACGQR